MSSTQLPDTPLGRKLADKQRLATAAATQDDGIAPQGRTLANSFASQVAALSPGECAMRGTPLDVRMALFEVQGKLSVMKERLRDSVGSSVREARKRTGGEYKISITDMIAPDNKLYIIAIVNRVDGINEPATDI